VDSGRSVAYQKYLHTVRESALALSIGAPAYIWSLCAYFLLVWMSTYAQYRLGSCRRNSCVPNTSSALTAYRYGALSGLCSTINFYFVPDTLHQSLLSDHPDTYTTKFNGWKVIKYQVLNSFLFSTDLGGPNFYPFVVPSLLCWLYWNGLIHTLLSWSSDLSNLQNLATTDLPEQFWCELAHAPSGMTPAWRHTIFS